MSRSGFILAERVALFAAVLVSVLLGLRQGSLEERIEQARERESTMVPGSFAPRYHTVDLAGREIRLGNTEADALLYFVYSSRCPYSERMVGVWSDLLESRQDGSTIEAVGLSLDSIPQSIEFEGLHHLPFRSVAIESLWERDMHRLGAAPQTIILTSDGEVVHSRIGTLDDPLSRDSLFEAVSRAVAMSERMRARGNDP